MAEDKYKTKLNKSMAERMSSAVKQMLVPNKEQQLYRDLTTDIFNVKFKDLTADHSSDIARWMVYQQYYDGVQWRDIARDPNRTKLTRNLCSRVVNVKGGLLGTKPSISVPKESERSIKGDIKDETGLGEQRLSDELDKVDVQQKIIKRWIRESQYERALKEGGKTASKFGVRYNYVYWDKEKKRPVVEELFPGMVRIKYRDALYNEVEQAFVSRPMTITAIKERYGIDAIQDSDTNLEYFRGSTSEYSYLDETRTQSLVTDFYCTTPHIKDGKQMIHGRIINQEVVWFEEWNDPIPLFPFRKNPQPGRRQGTSDLVGLVNTTSNGELSLQDDYNIINSDELDIIGLYAWPRIIIKTDGKIDVGVLQSTKSRIIKLPKDSSASVLEFTGKVYELGDHRDNLINDISRLTGVPKSALGVPDTSILTGAGINAEWQPLINEARDEFVQNLSLVIASELQYVAYLYRKYGGKEEETGMSYKDLLPEKLQLKVESGLQVPRDEMSWINMITTMKREGLISISTGIKLLNYVESSDDELKTIVKELLDPRYNPELALKIKEQEDRSAGVDEFAEEEKQYDENMTMVKGIPVGVSETKPAQHRIHLYVLDKFMKSSAYKALDEEETALFDEHYQAHENALQRGGGEAAAPPEVPTTPEMPGMPPMPEGGPSLGAPGMSLNPNPDLTPAPTAPTSANQPGQQPFTQTPSNVMPADYNK
jgi:hypothetical protein